MYEGSMRGAGSPFFAVWGWVISHMTPDRQHGTVVEINTEILAFVLGEKHEVVLEVIQKMCAPDLKSRSKAEEGRKLVKIGEYGYRVVNGAEYRRIRDEEERREYQANWQRVQRLIGKAVESGVGLEKGLLTPAEWKRYERAREKERSRRVKRVEHSGACDGAQTAIREGLSIQEKAGLDNCAPPPDFQ